MPDQRVLCPSCGYLVRPEHFDHCPSKLKNKKEERRKEIDMGHTPGPWKAVNDRYVITNGDDPFAIAQLGDDIMSPDFDEIKNNARLIAAAPDLLEACEEALEALFNLAPRYRKKGCFNSGDIPCRCTACKLNNAIAQAKGGE